MTGVRVKGSALLARREVITRQFGAEAWAKLVQDMAHVLPAFRSPVVAASLIPLREFLAFQDELVRRFFHGDDQAYFRLGEESARWALTEGPYKKFMARKDVAAFVQSIPSLSNAYWESAGATTYAAAIEGDAVHLRVTGLPVWHPYLEFLVVGYIGAALEMLCGTHVPKKCLKGGSGTEYHYAFTIPQGAPAR